MRKTKRGFRFVWFGFGKKLQRIVWFGLVLNLNFAFGFVLFCVHCAKRRRQVQKKGAVKIIQKANQRRQTNKQETQQDKAVTNFSLKSIERKKTNSKLNLRNKLELNRIESKSIFLRIKKLSKQQNARTKEFVQVWSLKYKRRMQTRKRKRLRRRRVNHTQA